MTTASQLIRRTMAQSVTSRFTAEQLCSAENRERCMKRLLKMPEIRFYADSVIKSAAILVPLCIHEDRLSLLYTVRSANLSRHSNEVSFPGGIRDETDESYTACALREAEEECGLRPEQIDVWGETRHFQTRHGIEIMPVVGFINDFDPAQLRINPDEVDEVFTVPLEVLSYPSNMRHTQFKSGKNNGYSVPAFLGGRYRIWGITGVVTHMFLMSLLPDELYGKRPVPFVPPSKI